LVLLTYRLFKKVLTVITCTIKVKKKICKNLVDIISIDDIIAFLDIEQIETILLLRSIVNYNNKKIITYRNYYGFLDLISCILVII
jgi:hypothetical protein